MSWNRVKNLISVLFVFVLIVFTHGYASADEIQANYVTITVRRGTVLNKSHVPTPASNDGYDFIGWEPSDPVDHIVLNAITFGAQFNAVGSESPKSENAYPEYPIEPTEPIFPIYPLAPGEPIEPSSPTGPTNPNPPTTPDIPPVPEEVIQDLEDIPTPQIMYEQAADDADGQLPLIPERVIPGQQDQPNQPTWTRPIIVQEPERLVVAEYCDIGYELEDVPIAASGFFNQISSPAHGDLSKTNAIIEQLIRDGTPTIAIGGNLIPLSAAGLNNYVWALANYILSMAGLILMAIMIIRLCLFKMRKHNVVHERMYRPLFITVGLILPLISKLLFIITQDMRLPVVLFDWWTLVHAAVLVLMSLCYIKMFRKRGRG
ncbi:MAG: hypothetical protein FWC66_09325 [Oscillospiraceae bacterium]|nr:hypothetical protein [Oscillospiraceae bacterium]